MDAEGFISHCQTQEVPPMARLTLLSDGSLVKLLRAVHLSEITVDVKDQRQILMGSEMAKFLDATDGLDAIIRDAWLCCHEKRLVYAHSVIDISRVGKMIQKEINRKSTPVGMLLSDYGVPLLRDQLFVMQLRSDQLAEEFSASESIFWARCYRLRGGEGFNAAILEVFPSYMFVSGY